MNKQIQVTAGIYNSTYTLTNHRDGSVTVKAPYVKWVGNTGYLAFEKTKITGKNQVITIKSMFLNDTTYFNGYFLTDILDSNN